MREAVDVDYITVDNEREALALENNLIKQRKPRFNILLRDDKTYPYIKLTLNDRYPKVFVTRKVRKDGGAYFGPYFPGEFGAPPGGPDPSELFDSKLQGGSEPVPSEGVFAVLHQALPGASCVEGFISPEQYKDTIRDVQLFLDGRTDELERAADRADGGGGGGRCSLRRRRGCGISW